MKKGDIAEGIIERVEFPNKGILTVDGERLVVKNTIPGQTVRVLVTKRRKGKSEGRVVEVLKKAPQEREEGVCPHFTRCGGCIYQSLPYEEQLNIKEGQIKELLFSVYPEGSFLWQGLKPSPLPDRYRNKMEFSFGDEVKGGDLALGMHRRGSFYDIVTTTDCRIVHQDFCRILEATLTYFQRRNVPFYQKLLHIGYLRHLFVRRAVKTGEILVDLVTTTQTGWMEEVKSEKGESNLTEEELLDGWKEAVCALELEGKLVGVIHTQNDSLADVVQNDRTEVLYGQDYFFEELLGLRFKITPFSFFQTNSAGAEVLYETARSYIGDTKDKVVFDLYSGTGTIAQLMASVAKRVIGVEIVEEAVEAALENAKLNGLHNCEFLAGDVLKVLDTIEEKPDMIILDPPRDGIHPKALQKIIRYGVENILYISCKPTSLVRDLEAFLAGGYAVERAVAVDMFPFTGGIESIVLLSKLHTKQNIEVELEMSEMDLTAAESKATYEEIKDYVLEHTGLKVSSLYIAQIKEKCGIIERVNYNQPKSENSRQPKCPLEKETAIRRALEHFHMI